MDWVSLLTNQTLILNGLALVLAVITFALLILTLISEKRRSKLSLKLLGIFAVISLCYMANSTWVYAIGVFIIATSITTLDFLEKLAAIVWRNDKYWEYKSEELRQSFSKAKKIAEKLEEEVNMPDTTIESDADEQSTAQTKSAECNKTGSPQNDEKSFGKNIHFIAGDYCNKELDYFSNLALSSPRAAITETWLMIESLISELSTLLNLDMGIIIKRNSYIKVLKSLVERDIAPSNLIKVVTDLRKLRNSVAHSNENLITYEQAREYIYMAAVAAGVLNNAKKLLETINHN